MAGFAEGPRTLSEEVSVKSVDVESVRVFFMRDVVEVCLPRFELYIIGTEVRSTL